MGQRGREPDEKDDPGLRKYPAEENCPKACKNANYQRGGDQYNAFPWLVTIKEAIENRSDPLPDR